MQTHSHDHRSAEQADYGKAFAIGTALNLGFVGIEVFFGLYANSMALLADAGHNLSDVLSLLIAWGATALSRRPPTERFTYGLRGSSILSALFNAMLLLIAVGAIAWEAVQRLGAPHPVSGMTVIAVAGAGVVINGFTAWLFTSGHGADLNVRGAYLHMVADAAVSAGVVAAGIVIIWTGALWIDPVVSLVIAVVILRSTWDLLRESVAMSLAAVPRGIDVKGVREFLASLDGVTRVHHLHIWPISTTETALTGHLVMPGGHPGDGYLKQVAHELEHRFGIRHTTMQIELGRGEPAEAGTDRVA